MQKVIAFDLLLNRRVERRAETSQGKCHTANMLSMQVMHDVGLAIKFFTETLLVYERSPRNLRSKVIAMSQYYC